MASPLIDPLLSGAGIPLATAGPLLRSHTDSSTVPQAKRDMSAVIATSPIRYSVMNSRVVSPGRVSPGFGDRPQPLAADELPPLSSDDKLRPRSVALPWSRTGRDSSRNEPRVATAPGDAGSRGAHPGRGTAPDAVYNTDSAMAGKATLATAIALSPVRPWPAPRQPPPTALTRNQRLYDDKSHLGPGCYGHEYGVVERIDKPRSVSPVLSRTQRFVDKPTSGTATVYDSAAMPMHMRTQAHQEHAQISSHVPRFQPIPGVDPDPRMKTILANLSVSDDRNNMAEAIAKDPRSYRCVLRSKAPRMAPASAGSDAYLRNRLRTVSQGTGALNYRTIQGSIHDPKSLRVVAPMRSSTENHPAPVSGGNVGNTNLGPGSYLDGVVTADEVVRPRTMGSRVIPPSRAARFRDALPAYKTLSVGMVYDDTVLGHRARSPAKSRLINLARGGGHDTFMSGANKSDVPDITYRTDVPGSPAASLATVVAHSPIRYSVLGPPRTRGRPTTVSGGSRGGSVSRKNASPAEEPRALRGTLFAQLEAKLKAEAALHKTDPIPPVTTITVNSRAAVFQIHEPHRPSSFMASRTGMDRSRPVSPSRADADATDGARARSASPRAPAAGRGLQQETHQPLSADKTVRNRQRVENIKHQLAELEPSKYGVELGIVVGPTSHGAGRASQQSALRGGSRPASVVGDGERAASQARRASAGAAAANDADDIDDILTRATAGSRTGSP